MTFVNETRLGKLMWAILLANPLLWLVVGAHNVVALPPRVCKAPVSPVDTSNPTTTVGTGTSASCTEGALEAAISKGGIIRFNCGGSKTILVDKQLVLRTDVDTVIDGKGIITLDGQGKTRILYFHSPNFRATRTKLIVQNMTFRNGNKSLGTPLPSASLPCSQGSDTDGGGGAIFVRDGILRVFNSRFFDNKAAPLGPDVGGGAIYTLGSLETTIVRSIFDGNSGSNAGAVGALFGNPSIYNSKFVNNKAVGNGANGYSATCPSLSIGSGGNGGAFYVDGDESEPVKVCGTRFVNNSGGSKAYGGAMFRAGGGSGQRIEIDRSLFKNNTSSAGGGAIYVHNLLLKMTATTLTGNKVTAGPGGGVFTTSCTLDFTNSTIHNNESMAQLGGGLSANNSEGTLLNLTFAGNKALAGPGYFGAALHADKQLMIRNTLFSNNITNDCYNPMSCSWGNNAGSNNIQWPLLRNNCSIQDNPCAAGTIFTDSQLSSTLKNNGGPTPTLLPSSTSPAKGAGTNCPTTDQRGISRSTTSCTLGAVESEFVRLCARATNGAKSNRSTDSAVGPLQTRYTNIDTLDLMCD